MSGNVYGEGVYFGINASVSAKYSLPDPNGIRYMLNCSVLVGDYTLGTKGIKTPPVKSVEPPDWYDSVCDNVMFPSMFVIFNDIQAYPKYLIVFRQKSMAPWHPIDLMTSKTVEIPKKAEISLPPQKPPNELKPTSQQPPKIPGESIKSSQEIKRNKLMIVYNFKLAMGGDCSY